MTAKIPNELKINLVEYLTFWLMFDTRHELKGMRYNEAKKELDNNIYPKSMIETTEVDVINSYKFLKFLKTLDKEIGVVR